MNFTDFRDVVWIHFRYMFSNWYEACSHWRIYNYSVCYERFQEQFSAVWSNAAHLTVLLIAIRNEHPRRAELPDNSQLRGGDV